MFTITEAAQNKLRQQLAQEDSWIGIGIKVKNSGCSGLSYVIEGAIGIEPSDININVNDLLILVDPESYKVIENATLDYVQHRFSHKFVFDNPLTIDECGCGDSFSIK